MIWRPQRQAAGLGEIGVAPITVADLKAHTRIDAADEDGPAAAYLAAAAGHVEAWTGRLLTERACALKLPGFPPRADGDILLPGGRCAEVTGVAYQDAANAALTLPAEDWELDAVSEPARLSLAGGSMWPLTRPWGLPVTIDYVAGYADGDQPPPLLQAVRMLAAELFEQRREAVIGASVADAAFGATALMAPYVLIRTF